MIPASIVSYLSVNRHMHVLKPEAINIIRRREKKIYRNVLTNIKTYLYIFIYKRDNYAQTKLP